MLCLLTIWLEWLELVKGKVFPTVEFWEVSTCSEEAVQEEGLSLSWKGAQGKRLICPVFWLYVREWVQKFQQPAGFCFAVRGDMHASTAPACNRSSPVGYGVVYRVPERALFCSHF